MAASRRRWHEVTSADADPAPRSGVVGLLRAPLVAGVVLLVVYGLLSFANHPDGYLGTDTGGKVLTLQMMEERGAVGGLDVGHWAERWDPEGDLHGYYGTRPSDDGSWVQVTTVPLMVAARPLWDAGGYRATLLLPMLGGVLCAFAARSLARRLGGSADAGDLAFWIVGLAGPVLIYALDLWEHTLGLAAMGWATVLVLRAVDAVGPRAVALPAIGAGVLWGIGFSMRTEALLYGAVVTAVLGVGLLRDRDVVPAALLGIGSAVGVAVGYAANAVLERSVLGGTLRGGRAGGAAGRFGSEPGTRFREGLTTTFGIDGSDAGMILGVVAVVALGLLIRRVARPGWTADRPDVILVALVAIPIALTFLSGLGFVPGFLIASPFAVAGIALAPEVAGRGPRLLVASVLVALPVVWAFQYLGGAGPQWGGRYVLLSAFVLTVAGVVRLAASDGPGLRIVLTVAVVVTAFGMAWMSVRTHGFASAGDDLAAIDEPVLIAKDQTGFLPREFVAANGDRRWLATLGQDELDRAVEIVSEAGFDRFGVLVLAGQSTPDELGGMRRVGTERISVVSGVELEVVRYAR
jgi:hypothetical protein